GSYRWSTSESSEEIILKSNNRFSYKITYGATERVSQGIWQYSKPNLILTSDSSLTSSYGTVSESKVSGISNYTIDFKDILCKIPAINLKVVINNQTHLIADSLGKVSTSVPIKTVHVMVPYVFDFFYYVKNMNSNHFVFCLGIGANHEIF